MSAEQEAPATNTLSNPSNIRKRKFKQKKTKNPSKKLRLPPPQSAMAEAKRKKPSKKMLKIFQKRAKKYHSDSDSDDETKQKENEEREIEEEETEDEREDEMEGDSSDGDSGDEGRKDNNGVMRFTEGCRAFKVAFLKIMKKSLPNDPLGPILSAHKKLVAAKLAEDEEEQKVKGESKKEKHLVAEKGHVMPPNFLDSKEKLLISIATKGVVRLFNAVSKAQNPQKGLNPSKSKDAKALARKRKQTFLSELKKPLSDSTKGESEKVGWAPLSDSYMLGSKLKDWDKFADTAEADNECGVAMESSEDDE